MSILWLIIETMKLSLLDYKNINKYCSKYQKAFDTVCSLIFTNTKIPTKVAEVFLQAGLLTKMENKYSFIVFIIEMK